MQNPSNPDFTGNGQLPVIKQESIDQKYRDTVSTELQDSNQLTAPEAINEEILGRIFKISENTFRKETEDELFTSKLKGSNGKKRTTDFSSKQNQQNFVPELSSQSPRKQVRINSQKMIKLIPEVENMEQGQEKEPEEQISSKRNVYSDLSREFQYRGDFSIIRKVCAQLALESKVKIVQNSDSFLTLKISSVNYCECLLHSCFTFLEPAVYQLKNSLYKKNKAKFILVAGKESQFQCFFKKLLQKLWGSNAIKQTLSTLCRLNQEDAVALFFDQFYKEYNKMSKRLSNSIIKDARKEDHVLSNNNYNLNKTKITEGRLNKFASHLKGLTEELKKDLVERSDSFRHEINEESLESEVQKKLYARNELSVWKLYSLFFHEQAIRMSRRKEEILKQYSIKKVFAYLDIEEQFDLFLKHCSNKNKSSSETPKTETQNSVPSESRATIPAPTHPYEKCVKLLESFATLNSSDPKRAVGDLGLFRKTMKSQYGEYYQNHMQLVNMDEELPLTIYCVLMADLDAGFIAMIKWLLSYLESQVDYGLERKILTTLEAAVAFINEEWKIGPEESRTVLKQGSH